MTRARRKARLSIRFSGPASQRFHSSVVEMISVAPMKPGRPSAAGSGNSSIVPNSPAKVLRNSPSAGSSGTTTSRGFVWATPAAACSDARIWPAAGWVWELWSWAIFAGKRSRHSSGSIRSGCLRRERKV